MQTQIDKRKTDFKLIPKICFLEFDDKFRLINFYNKNYYQTPKSAKSNIEKKYTENLTISDIKYVFVFGYAGINFYSFFEINYNHSNFKLKSLNWSLWKIYLFINKLNCKHLKQRIAKHSDWNILKDDFENFKNIWKLKLKDKLKSIIIDNTLRAIFEIINKKINYSFSTKVIKKYYHAFEVKFIYNDIYVYFKPKLIDKLNNYNLQDILNIILSLKTWDDKHVKIKNNCIEFKTKLLQEINF